MTFREKLAKEYPMFVSDLFTGGCKGCPNNYWPVNDNCTVRITEDGCRNCWDREVPESEVGMRTVVDIHGEICDGIKELYKEKNKAYGNSFHNARKEVPCYTLGKLYDKFSRYMNLTKNPENAAFESIEDTLLDMANYCIMELAEIRAEKGE